MIRFICVGGIYYKGKLNKGEGKKMNEMIKKFRVLNDEVIEVEDMEKDVGYSIDGVGLLELCREVGKRYGSKEFIDYFEECILNVGLEGFEKEDVVGLMRFLKDMVLYDEYKD